MNMSQINISDYPISCIIQNKVILGYGYKRNKINGCLWNGIIRISMKFVDNAMWILNTIAYINSADFIILDLIMRIYLTYIT